MTSGASAFWTSGAVPLIEPEFLSSIIGAASDIALVISAGGIVLSVVVNDSAPGIGDLDHWEGRPVMDFLTDESVVKFDKAHKSYLSGVVPARSIELNHCDADVWQYPVRYTFHRFGKDDAALLLGRDLRPIAETQQQLVQAQIALEQGYEARREFDARYRVVMGQTSEPILFVSGQSGRIEDANPAAAKLFGMKAEAMAGTQLSSLINERSGSNLLENLMNATLSDEQADVHIRLKRTGMDVRVRPTVFRSGGQRILMCRLAGDSEASASPDAAAMQASALFHNCTDAILFIDPKGTIVSVNDGFLDLVGAAHMGDVVGNPVADFLSRGQIDLSVLTDRPEHGHHVRLYSTKIRNGLGAMIPVEISATSLGDAAGFGLIVRDATRADATRPSHGGGQADSSRNVVELVGSASLKEIVAETTDVVEKMCIEAAVTLTKNNRVAAAEMLGLSRQSLYVKLRKYGLLSKD